MLFYVHVHTLSVGELLSESVSSDDQHPLDPPEQHDVITLQLLESQLQLLYTIFS